MPDIGLAIALGLALFAFLYTMLVCAGAIGAGSASKTGNYSFDFGEVLFVDAVLLTIAILAYRFL